MSSEGTVACSEGGRKGALQKDGRTWILRKRDPNPSFAISHMALSKSFAVNYLTFHLGDEKRIMIPSLKKELL